MEVFETVEGWRRSMEAARSTGRTVGFVPTMGALHAGHRSLIDRAVAECDRVGVSVFVNPLQFDDATDIAEYPRTIDADLALCEAAGVSAVFVPTVREMYPNWPEQAPTRVTVDGLTERWEGSARPGHFDGVCTVVAKLFSATGASRAYFGEKDFQQLAVVRQMASDLSMPVEVIGCPTVREGDGLALSSRNVRLGEVERAVAPVLSDALCAGARLLEGGELRTAAVVEKMTEVFEAEPLVALDYAAAVDPASLEMPSVFEPGDDVRLLVAARLGPVRLIDNCAVKVPAVVTERPAVLVGAGRMIDEATARLDTELSQTISNR